MLKLPVAIQLYSLRDDCAKDYYGTLKKVKAMGYDGVEITGMYGHTPAEIRKMCEEIGLVPVSAHVPFADLMKDPQKIIADYKEIGCKQVVIPYLVEKYRPGHEGFGEIIEGAKIIGEECKKQGMYLAYHNHDFEFVKLGDQYALDVLYSEVPEDLLKCQLDTCWVNVGGEDPAQYVLKYTGRQYTVHLKDFVGVKSEKMYALIGIDDGKQSEEKEDEKFSFRPVGYGKQDFPSIIDASEKAGAEWLVVEQDNPSMDKTAMECAQMSIEYLKSL